jgi:primosomal protein N' (replication factor Y)
MLKRYNNAKVAPVTVINMQEYGQAAYKHLISKPLQTAIKETLDKKQQVILLINRRGYSTYTQCQGCGHVIECPNCAIPMIWHSKDNMLKCHYCNHAEYFPDKCPNCGFEGLKNSGTGTQKIEAQINKIFPEASVIRMDVDTTSAKNAHEIILNKFREEKIDILLGTQMITKGHDFENVTLVGVLAADSSINIGDYRAQERTFQLLTQVAGRSGRGEKKGRAIIQTYMPDEFSIITAQKQDYLTFYRQEIKVREKLKYPPFCDIMIAVVIGQNEAEIIEDANKLYNIFKGCYETYPPMPAPISKINDNYRWRILIKASINEKDIDTINFCLDNFEAVKNKNTKLNFDINPNNMS